jgi:ribonuclease VapC
MFVDASAMVAVLAPEDDGPALAHLIDRAPNVSTSALAIYETALGLARKRAITVEQAVEAVDVLLRNSKIEIVPITAEIGHAALRAFARYGRGRHPAQLNMGDCFAYACARARNVPLLYKGDDFAQTDLA